MKANSNDDVECGCKFNKRIENLTKNHCKKKKTMLADNHYL
jgi:hypothetical protein